MTREYMRFYVFLLIIALPQNLEGQFVQENDLQLLLPDAKSKYGVVPAGKNGLVFFHEIPNLESFTTRTWEIIFLNTKLELLRKSYFESDNKFRITHVKHSGDYIYLLFQDANIPMRSAFFARANISEDNFEFFEVKEFLPKEILGFEILGNSLFLIGWDNNRPAILKFTYGVLRPQVLQGLYTDNHELLNVKVLPKQDLIQIVSRLKKRRGNNNVLLIKQFDKNAKIHKDIRIESSKGYHLLDAIATTDRIGNLCVVGTYAYKNSQMSNGIFTVVFGDQGFHPMYYYDYTNLHNYFSYLPEKEQKRLERKYDVGKKGNRKSLYKENQVPRHLIKTNDSWMFVGEIVRIKERNARMYGDMWPMEYRQFSHAIILGIGEDGKLTWDNSFAMNEYVTNSMLPQVQLDTFSDYSILYYLHDHYINYKIIDRDKNISEGAFKIELSPSEFTNEKNFKFDDIMRWYDNTFVVFGSSISTPKYGENKRFLFLHTFTPSSDLPGQTP